MRPDQLRFQRGAAGCGYYVMIASAMFVVLVFVLVFGALLLAR